MVLRLSLSSTMFDIPIHAQIKKATNNPGAEEQMVYLMQKKKKKKKDSEIEESGK